MKLKQLHIEYCLQQMVSWIFNPETNLGRVLSMS
jgi:hypothetical protein